MSRESRNQNQPTCDHRANRPCPPAAAREDQCWAAGDIEGGTAKRREEYKKCDGLRQENENTQAVGSLTPTTAAPPAGFGDQNWENPSSKEGLAGRDIATAKSGEEYKESGGLGQENENPQAARAEYIFLPPDIRTEYIFLPPAIVAPPAQSTRPGASQCASVRTLPPTSVAPPAQSTWPDRSLPVAVKTQYNCPVRSLPPTTVAPPAQSTCPGTSYRGAYTTENRVKRKRPVGNEAASAKPHRCRFCKASFPTRQSLSGHMRVHGQDQQNEFAEREDEVGGQMSDDCLLPSFECRFCPKIFCTPRGRGGHMKQHSQEMKEEKMDRERNRPESKGQLSQSMIHSNGTPSQIQSQFAGTPTLPPSSLQSQLTAPQAQQGQYHHTPNMRVVDLNVDLWQVEDFGKPEDLAPINIHNWPLPPQGNSFDLNADLWRSLDSGKPEGLAAINIQNRPLGAKTTWCNRPDMVPSTSTRTTQDPQPHHDQPQLMHSHPKSGVGASMQRNYPYSLGQGMASSSSSTVAVTQEGFNPSFQRHQHHSDPNSSVGQGMASSSSSSPVAVTQGGFSPSIQRQNPASPTRNSRFNQESRLANVSGTFKGNIAQPSQFRLSLGCNYQNDINAVAREVINVSSSFSNSDIDRSSSSE